MKITQKRRELLFILMMIAPAVITLIALNVYPLATAIESSFFKIHPVTRDSSWVGIKHFQKYIVNPEFWAATGRSAIWTIGGVVMQVALGIVISLLLHKEIKGRAFARAVVLWPYVVPTVVAASSFRFLLNPLTGYINYIFHDVLNLIPDINWLGDSNYAMLAAIFVSLWKFVPFMIIMFLARLQTTPLELYDAVKIDGANRWQEFRYITLPWLQPTIIVAALLRTMWLFKEFDLIYLLTQGGPSQTTRTLPLLIFFAAFDRRKMGEAAAISIMMLIMVIPLAFAYLSRYQKSEDEITL
ncbi:MAG: sugar ABC transporter permease [Anaerolineaceae bacterium]|nr:sugar ABC transporter permease [Anaerolineaceae bacterium]